MYRWKNKSLEKGRIKERVFANVSAYVVLIAAVASMMFFGVCSPKGGNSINDGVAAKVDGEEVSYDEFRRAYEMTYQQYSRMYQDAFDASKLKLARNVMDELINERVVFEQARQAGLVASRKETEKQILEIFKDDKGNFDAKNFHDRLRYNGYSEASFFEKMRRDLTVNKYRRLMMETGFYAGPFAEMDYRLDETKLDVEYLKFSPDAIKISVTQADVDKFLNDDGKKKVKEYYEKNSSEFKKEEKVKASHILIAYKGARRASGDAEKRTKDAAKSFAEKVYAESTKTGADFAAMAQKYTDEASGKTKGGELGIFSRNDMVKEFSDAAFAMKVGEVKGPVESPFGFHIIKLTERQPGSEKTLAQATNDIARTLIEKEKRPEVLKSRAEEVLTGLKSGKISNAQITQYVKEGWKSSGEFAVESRSVPNLGSEEALLAAVFSLEKPGQVYEKIVDSSGSKFILRLKMRKDADLAKFDQKRREDVARSASYSFAGSAFSALNEQFEEELNKSGKIWRNAKYLAIDERNAQNEGG